MEAAVIVAKVPLTEAEARLAEFWQEADDDARAHGRAGALRLRALNLLVVARDEAQAEAADRVLAEVTPHHPARVVIFRMGAAPARPGPLQVEVAGATCLSRDGIQQVCREQIVIPVTGAEPLDALAEPLLLPDAPIVLWLPSQADLALPDCLTLAEMAGRVIVDSATLSDPVTGVQALAALLAEPTRDFTITDLNWARLTPWRELTADLFDDPLRRPLLRSVRRLLLSYASERPEGGDGGGHESQAAAALLYAGWLAGRLGWTVAGEAWRPEEPGFATGLRRPPDVVAGLPETVPLSGTVVLAQLQPRRCKSVAEVGLESVVLETGDAAGRPPVVFSLSRTAGATPAEGVCATRIREGAQETQMRTITLPHPPVAALLGGELDYLGRDRLYEESLLLAARLAALPAAHSLIG